MGVIGAASAGVLSQTTGTLLGLGILLSGRSRLRLSFRNYHLDLRIIWRLIKIGLPASIMGLQNQFGQLMMTSFVISFGTAAVAAHSLCHVSI
jgi:Na+-driven multidrug efflux pump